MTITPARSRTQTPRRKRHRVPSPGRHAISLLPEAAPEPDPAAPAEPRSPHAPEARSAHAPEEGALQAPEDGGPRSRRAPARRTCLRSALLRCALYLGPISVAVAAAGPLSRVAWPVPIVTLLLGWSAAQTLTSVGAAVARRGGPSAAARLEGCGFAADAAL
ncbi:hypothetical protein AB0J83_49850, partial [Actinoplanes sp. NPDC049596]